MPRDAVWQISQGGAFLPSFQVMWLQEVLSICTSPSVVFFFIGHGEHGDPLSVWHARFSVVLCRRGYMYIYYFRSCLAISRIVHILRFEGSY